MGQPLFFDIFCLLRCDIKHLDYEIFTSHSKNFVNFDVNLRWLGASSNYHLRTFWLGSKFGLQCGFI